MISVNRLSMELEGRYQPTEYEEQLPGFRFHPTEEELLVFYLKGVAHGKRSGLILDVIGNVNIYRHEPWELPGLAKIGEREWYFFVPRDRKNGANGGRPNRTTKTGYWKATGSDRQIRHAKEPKRVLGLKKTLVFYMGRAPRGTKTDWVMNEYRLPDTCMGTLPKEEIVLCKIYRKATSLKVLEQRAAMEEGAVTMVLHGASFFGDANSSSNQEALQKIAPVNFEQAFKEEEVEREEEMISSSQVLDKKGKDPLSELHVPTYGSFDWGHEDPFLLRSPWMENWASFVNVMFNY